VHALRIDGHSLCAFEAQAHLAQIASRADVQGWLPPGGRRAQHQVDARIQVAVSGSVI
jgi:hypothetical protein